MISAKEHKQLLLLVSRWEKAGIFKPAPKRKISKRLKVKVLLGASFLLLLPATGFSADRISTAETNPVAVAPAKKPLVSAVKKAEKKEAKLKDEKFVEKSVLGTVGFIRKDKMSVELNGQDGEEILFTIDGKVKLANAKNISQIAYGVTVRVTYKESFLAPKEEGGKPTVLNRVVKEIKFIKPAVSQNASMEGASDENA